MGDIDIGEVRGVFNSLGVKVTNAELEEKIEQIDSDRNGKISFSEFIYLMRDTVTDIQDDEKLQEAFNMFDTDKDGVINIDELSTIMKKLGQDLSQEQLKEMIRTADLDRDGTISITSSR